MFSLRVLLPIACLASFHSAANGELPPPIENPVIDEYGVELKSGRLGGLSVPLISIGGDGVYNLTWVYAPQDGRYLFSRSLFDVRTDEYRVNSVYYDITTFRYPGGTSKFRKINGTWEPEFADGSTFDGATFTDKYGVRISGGKLSYPDGREVWAGSTSFTFDPLPTNMREMRNNFGFWLKSGAGLQAINMAYDYCPSDFSAKCQGVSAVREATITANGWNSMALRNAAGETTNVTFVPIFGYDREPCELTSGGPVCNGIGTTYYYPATVRYPGSSTSDKTIAYGGSGDPETITHNEIVIDTLMDRGVSVDYANTVYPYSGGGPGSGPSGSQVQVSAAVDGLQRIYAKSYNYGGAWPTGNLNLSTVVNALGHQTSFSYNEKGDVRGISMPGGGGKLLNFDSRFNVTKVTVNPKANSGQSAQVTEYIYEASCTTANQAYCNLPKRVIDPRGGVTDFAYNARGQIITRTDPAPATGGTRPVTRFEYTMRTARILNSSGGTVAAGSAISMLTRTSTCASSASCQGTNDEIVTQYDYGPTSGPNNLLLKGVAVTAVNSSGQLETLRTCYQYNYFGERISETKPQAGLSSCQ
ncbi:hypothetical protein [Erythrobacter sp. SAORIC-644]|uniref:hypothetical protein n=1 Tax=Erythrobacter sp. SAORIC-644 TaxID=1869314 RepID=UPI0011AF3BDA|nr:hypothetical protein [Erythrobacter sp. SAORIC-644]